MKNQKKQKLNTTYNKAFRFRFYPDSEQKTLLEHYFGSTRFTYNKTLDYSINHYAGRETKVTDDYGDLLTIKNEDFKPLSSTDRSKVSSLTVTKEPNGHYYIVFLSEESFKRLPSTNERLAFDSGIKTNITSFNGKINKANKEVFNTFNLPSLDKLLDRIKLIQKSLSRKMKGSSNINKTRLKLAKLYAKKENIVNDFYHKLSSKIVNENQVIIAEDLNFISMKENKSNPKDINKKTINRSLQNISLSKIYQYIEYKAKWYGKTFIRADKYYPSSKLCSTPNCEYINHELKLENRAWKCPCCNKVHDRDNNAALNLFNYTEDNAKRIIDKVLSYHKKKINNPILKEKQSTKIVNNKNLNFKV